MASSQAEGVVMTRVGDEVVVIDLDNYPYRILESSIDWIEDPAEVALCFRRSGQILRVFRTKHGLMTASIEGERLSPAEMARILVRALERGPRIKVPPSADLDALWCLVEGPFQEGDG